MHTTCINHMCGMVSDMVFHLSGVLGYVTAILAYFPLVCCPPPPAYTYLLSYQLILASRKDQQLIGDEEVIAIRFIRQRNCRVCYYAIFFTIG